MSPALLRKWGTLKLIHPSVRLSVCHKNFYLAHIWSINNRALIFGMHDPCEKPFQLASCHDLDLLPTSMSNLWPYGGPQFSEFYSLVKCCRESTSIAVVCHPYTSMCLCIHQGPCLLFSSPEPTARVSYCHSALSVVRPSARQSSVCLA